MRCIKAGATALAATAVVLCSCAAPTMELPFDRTHAGNPRVIGLVKPVSPERAAAPIPVIGDLLVTATVAVMRNNRESSLDDIAYRRNFNFTDQLTHSVIGELTREGYAVKMVDLPRDGSKPIDKTAIAGRADLAVDAVLDMTVTGYGYVAASNSRDAPYRPFAVVNVQLLRANGANDVLMKDIVVYNPYDNPSDVVSIPPDPQYSFVHFSDIEAEPADAVSGMVAAAEQTGQAVAQLLR